MELTIEQALQHGVTAHQEGNLKEAERLYRLILHTQPQHPDANHNLGLIAVSVDQAVAALPLFKIALEVNPKIEQFWLSYIDALIKEQQFELAERVLEEGKKLGVAGEKLNALESQLKPIIQQKKQKKQNSKALIPSDAEINNLLQQYRNGQHHEAELSAMSLSKKFPEHPLAWKVLSVVFKKAGKISESLDAIKKSLQLMPQDTEAHYNLGNTLRELGRLDEAEASYKQAIMLNREFAEAHYNLGVTLKEMGRLYEAEASYTQATTLKPDYAEAHNNLGITLQELDRLDEAEASYKKAIALMPDNVSAKHMLAALTGEITTTSPRDYVKGLFDNYSTKFESSLVGDLEYKIPKLATQMILEDHKDCSLGSVLDLGCGTGLSGVEIKPYCEYLEGIDLSNNMLEEARKKNVYDKLVQLDIQEYLASENLDFDYFISTDVFLYVGDLSDIFRLIKTRNKTGGKLVLSVEDHDGDGFFLEQSGRYSHSKKYIKSLCEKFGYSLSHLQYQNIRKERNQYIKGYLYLLNI